MRKKAFLLAAGSAKRWNGISKQKICVRGEMLIDRLIRQIREYTDEITIITWDRSLMRPGCAFIDTRYPTSSFSHALLLTLDHWSDQNYIFATDTYYSNAFIKRVFQTDRYTFFGYYTKPPKYLLKNQERAAICLPLGMKDQVEAGLVRCITEGINHKSEIHNEMIGFTCGSSHFLLYRCLKRGGPVGFIAWKIKPFINSIQNFIEISDSTSEFDTPEEFKNWCIGRPKYYEGVC